MLIVRADLGWNVRVGEDGELALWFWSDSSALDVLITAEADIDGGIAHGLEQLRARVLVEHSFTKRTKLLPFVAAILDARAESQIVQRENEHTHDELLVPDSNREVAVERDSEVIRIVTLVGDDMLEKGCLMPEDLRETSADCLRQPLPLTSSQH